MERLVLKLQSEDVFIGGQAPTTVYDCAKSHVMVAGLPLEFLTPSRSLNMSLDSMMVRVEESPFQYIPYQPLIEWD